MKSTVGLAVLIGFATIAFPTDVPFQTEFTPDISAVVEDRVTESQIVDPSITTTLRNSKQSDKSTVTAQAEPKSNTIPFISNNNSQNYPPRPTLIRKTPIVCLVS